MGDGSHATPSSSSPSPPSSPPRRPRGKVSCRAPKLVPRLCQLRNPPRGPVSPTLSELGLATTASLPPPPAPSPAARTAAAGALLSLSFSFPFRLPPRGPPARLAHRAGVPPPPPSDMAAGCRPLEASTYGATPPIPSSLSSTSCAERKGKLPSAHSTLSPAPAGPTPSPNSAPRRGPLACAQGKAGDRAGQGRSEQGGARQIRARPCQCLADRAQVSKRVWL